MVTSWHLLVTRFSSVRFFFALFSKTSADHSAVHHASIDRIYWIWQNLKPAERTKALYGPTFMSDTTSPPATLQDKLTMGAAYPGDITIEDASSTMAGSFCYTYM